MDMERKTRSQSAEIRPVIDQYVKEGKTFKEIAVLMGMKSEQLVRYHFNRYRELQEPQKVEPKQN